MLIQRRCLYETYKLLNNKDLLLSKFVNKYINTFNYEELLNLYEILKIDDDIIFKWYSNLIDENTLPKNKISKLLKEFKIK